MEDMVDSLSVRFWLLVVEVGKNKMFMASLVV